jgi:pSer/pThr/pTyr-binding forkhead associated (FHA) protein
MTELTLTLIKLAFLAVLWLFVLAAVGVIRADLFGSSKAMAKLAAKAQRPPKARKKPRQPKQPQPAPQPQGQSQAAAATVRGEPSVLVVTQGPLAGTTLDLGNAPAPITMGRANDATLVLGDDYASGRHARLFSQGGQWIVEDLGSTNGTYLGRSKVTRPTPVDIGVPIRIGKTVIELRK